MNYEVYFNKWKLVDNLNVFCRIWFPNIKHIEYFAYMKPNYKTGTYRENIEEFIRLEWASGGYSYANNNCNSLSATARNVMRMIDGGVYENVEFYEEIMESEEWKRI